MGWVGYLKGLAGPVDDVTPCHYGTCNIYRMFVDVVYITAPATAICKMMLSVPHALTTSWVSVTKAGGLSDAPGAERSPDGKKWRYCDTYFRVFHRSTDGLLARGIKPLCLAYVYLLWI